MLKKQTAVLLTTRPRLGVVAVPLISCVGKSGEEVMDKLRRAVTGSFTTRGNCSGEPYQASKELVPARLQAEMTVVSDAGPLIYLHLVAATEVLPRLFGTVSVPNVVLQELKGSTNPKLEPARQWANNPFNGRFMRLVLGCAFGGRQPPLSSAKSTRGGGHQHSRGASWPPAHDHHPDLRQPAVETQRRASHDMNNGMPQIAVSAPLLLASFRQAPDDGDYDMALVTIEGRIVLMSSMRYAEKRSGSSMIVP